jgi:hypothetical protein
VPGMPLATLTSDNSAHGFNLTFAFPMILFIVIVAALLLLYRRPHRVPGHGELRVWASGEARAGTAAVDPDRVPNADAARAAAVAAGLGTAPGGGAMESPHEAAGAHRAASTTGGRGNVSDDENQAAAPGPGPDVSSTADSSSSEDEASE